MTGIADEQGLVGRARFSIREIIVGPYDSAGSHDLHFAQTYGSGDAVIDSTDELRFDTTTARLVSVRVSVPERPTSEPTYLDEYRSLPVRRGLPELTRGKPMQMVVGDSIHVGPAGDVLVVFQKEGTAPTQRLRIAADLDLFLDAELAVAGLALQSPAAHLVAGWSDPPQAPLSPRLASLLAEHLNLVDGRFVDALEEADAGARRRLERLLSELAAVPPSPQCAVLEDRIREIVETFYRAE